ATRPLALHDALPIYANPLAPSFGIDGPPVAITSAGAMAAPSLHCTVKPLSSRATSCTSALHRSSTPPLAHSASSISTICRAAPRSEERRGGEEGGRW